MKVYLDKNVVIKEFEDQGLLINTELAFYRKLNSTGLYIAKYLKNHEGSNVEEIVENVSEAYGIPIKLLDEDIQNFILNLVKEEFFHSDKKIIAIEKNDFLDNENIIWIQVTNKCNLHCAYCYADAGESKENLTINEIEMLLSVLQDHQYKKIAITGGETLVRKDIIEILDVCRKYGKTMLLTNGTIGDRALYEKILERVESIQISLDSSKPEIHDKNRGSGTFEKVVHTISMIAEIDPNKIAVAMTPTLDFEENLKNMIDFCLKYSVQNLHVNKLMPLGRAKNIYEESLDLNKFYAWADVGYRYLNELYSKAQKERTDFYFHLDIASDLRTSVKAKSRKYSCGLNFNLISVSYNGDVYLCPSLHVEELKLGNIREANIILIFNEAKKKYGDFHVENLSKCQKCNFRYYCGGGCRALAQIYHHDIFGEDIYCENY